MSTYRYFWIANSLRGGYMPDSSCHIRARTRRELKSALEDMCGYGQHEGDTPTKRDIASLAAAAWREWAPWRQSRQYLPMVAPYRGNPGYGLECGLSSQQEWKQSQEDGE